ncbi:RNA polymerase subunit sigma-24 [Intrasporangium chromatireducens Q5-1]|uniref:RNA polymerase subunit sigma-24 n=1 Tax=Intrasporangium chromatireducens Q5-1 TaxID=584657 RepID=W9GMP1_9MICO|nr:sigma-70 family RNA polymerase sigma factor [Intrasporangium chromatireducens]EWT07501.1 RNA polymerase subunit sigma-24 [Intrasporangium chromatireducens Q5-1]
MSDPDRARRTVEAVWRMEAAKVTAVVARLVGDVGLAEDLAQDAFVQALEQWPRDGVPDGPGAWLTATARRRAIDRIRRDVNLADKLQQLGHAEQLRVAALAESEFDLALEDLKDDVLALIFAACHPQLSAESRIALTLRMIGGLTTREVARALLAPEKTVGQRISRAKRTLAADGVTLAIPSGEELDRRLASVLEAVYLIFNEGYAATSGRDWVRGDLMEEAIRLGRVLTALAPAEPEVFGLLALMEIQASRTRARIAPDGSPVLLLDQDRTRWDWTLIRHALAALARASQLSGIRGPYVLQAEIAACHARASRADETDWARIVALYEELGRIVPSPVIDLNRAVALSYAAEPAAALAVVDALVEAGALTDYHLLPSVRGDLLERLGRRAEARAEFARAAELTENEAERALLLRRAASGSPRDVSRAPQPR